MSRSYRKPYDNYVKHNNKAQKADRNRSRKLIRLKSKRNVKALMLDPDTPYEGISFKDGYDEWCFPSDGHQRYVKVYGDAPCSSRWSEEDWDRLKKYRRKLMRK